MTIQQCYDILGGDYSDILNRFRNEDRVKRFALMFLQDNSYVQLTDSLAAGDYETAFRASHTIKGLGQNLSFTALHTAADQLTEALRGGQTEGLEPLVQAVNDAYVRTSDALHAFEADPE